MNVNMNLNLISIILYLCGIVGIFIFFLFVILAIKKKTKASAVLSVLMLILSIALLGSGSFLKISYDKKHPKPKPVTSEAAQQSSENSQSLEAKKASIDDLKFDYTFSSYDSKNQTANMNIKNNSDSVFNGQVKVDFLNSSRQIIDSLQLNIKNLIPNKTYSPDAFVSSDVSSIEYSFSGSFSEENIDQIPYSISKVSTGNKFVRINVTVSDTSKNHLEQVCNELAYNNSSTQINGLLVYFYPENSSANELNFDNIIADYYLNNVNKTSKFTYYK